MASNKFIAEWDELDCTEWLIRINPINAKYIARFLGYCGLNGFHGQTLKNLTNRDLMLMGVAEGKERNIILRGIQYEVSRANGTVTVNTAQNSSGPNTSYSEHVEDFQVIVQKYAYMGLDLKGHQDKCVLVVNVHPDAPKEIQEKIKVGDRITRINEMKTCMLTSLDVVAHAITKGIPIGSWLHLGIIRCPGSSDQTRRLSNQGLSANKAIKVDLSDEESEESETSEEEGSNESAEDSSDESSEEKDGSPPKHSSTRNTTEKEKHQCMKCGQIFITTESFISHSRQCHGKKRHIEKDSDASQMKSLSPFEDGTITLKKESDMGLTLRADLERICLYVSKISDSAPKEVSEKLSVGDNIMSLNGMLARDKKDLAFIKNKILVTFKIGQMMKLTVERAKQKAEEAKPFKESPKIQSSDKEEGRSHSPKADLYLCGICMREFGTGAALASHSKSCAEKNKKAKIKEKVSGDDDDTFPIGSMVSKKFGKKTYEGEIISYHKEKRCYRIKYEDGDEEEMNADEVKRHMLFDV